MKNHFALKFFLCFFLLAILASFNSISNAPVINKYEKAYLQHQALNLKRVLIIEFYFMHNGCNHQVFIAFETSTGNGYGFMKRFCPGSPTQTIWFNIYEVVVIRGATAENFDDFRDEHGSIDIDNEVKELLAEGMNNCEQWD